MQRNDSEESISNNINLTVSQALLNAQQALKKTITNAKESQTRRYKSALRGQAKVNSSLKARGSLNSNDFSH